MTYSFDQENTIDLSNTSLSVAAQDIIQDILQDNPHALQTDVLEAFRANIEGIGPTIQYTDLYRYVFEEISQDDSNGNLTAKADVDASAWLWVRGAIEVNTNNKNSYFAQFIRDYTAEQYMQRYGEITSSEIAQRIQFASNRIALNFVRDILGLDSDHTNSNHELSPLKVIGEIDAAGAASQVFNGQKESGGDYAPWAGTILFPFLGQGGFVGETISQSFFSQWQLQIGSVANTHISPETQYFKPLAGTYDLVSTVAAVHNITDFGSILANALNLYDVMHDNTIGYLATNTLLSGLRSAATTFFEQAYDIPDINAFQIGESLPLYAPTDLSGSQFAFKETSYIVGTLGNDSQIITHTGDDVVNAGPGDDFIQGLTGHDVIDGDQGIDTLSYSLMAQGITVTEEGTSGLYQDRFHIIGNGAQTLDAYVYSVEKIVGTDSNDTFNLFTPTVLGTRVFDGGGGTDTVHYAGTVSLFDMNTNSVYDSTGNAVDRLNHFETYDFKADTIRPNYGQNYTFVSNMSTGYDYSQASGPATITITANTAISPHNYFEPQVSSNLNHVVDLDVVLTSPGTGNVHHTGSVITQSLDGHIRDYEGSVTPLTVAGTNYGDYVTISSNGESIDQRVNFNSGRGNDTVTIDPSIDLRIGGVTYQYSGGQDIVYNANKLYGTVINQNVTGVYETVTSTPDTGSSGVHEKIFNITLATSGGGSLTLTNFDAVDRGTGYSTTYGAITFYGATSSGYVDFDAAGNPVIHSTPYTTPHVADTYAPQPGYDHKFQGTAADETITATTGPDIIDAGGGTNTVYAGQGNNAIINANGNTTVYSGDGSDDYLIATNVSTVVHDTGGFNRLSVFGDISTFNFAFNNDVMSVSDYASTFAVVDDYHRFLTVDGGDNLTAKIFDLAAGIQDFVTATWVSDSTDQTIDNSQASDFAVVHLGVGNDTYTASGFGDFVYGNDGNDTIYGGGGGDTVFGDKGNDYIFVGGGNNTMVGGEGDDRFDIAGGQNYVDGGSGTDTVYFWNSFNSMTLDLGAGTAVDAAGQSTVLTNIESVMGSQYNDLMIGSAGNDTLNGYDGNDTIRGMDGDDVLRGGRGDDIIDGGAGSDTIDFSWSDDGVTVNLASGTSVGEGTDQFTNIENIFGSYANDTLIGNSADNIINGWMGDDRISGGAGNDVLDGGTGINTADYGAATGGINVNLSMGKAFNDGYGSFDTLANFSNVTGSSYGDIIGGNSGNNVMEGGAGVDTVSYANALSAVTVSLLTATAQNTIGAGTDTLSGFENLTGSGFNDTLTGDANANVIQGGQGNDVMNGGAGTDIVSYGDALGAVTVNIGITTAQNTLGAGTDTLQNFEMLIGSNFNDTLRVGALQSVEGGLGDDVLIATGGNCTASYIDATAGVVVNLVITSAQDTVGAGHDTLSNFANLVGSSFDDVLTGKATGSTISGRDGNDFIYATPGNDVLDGGNGIDTISYENASGNVGVSIATSKNGTGSSGTDYLSNFENLIGSSHNDTLVGTSDNNVIEGGDGNDSINGGAGIDTASYQHAAVGVSVSLAITAAQNTAGAGTDTLISMENLLGSSHDDVLTGSTANNVIEGGLGNDTLNGGAGTDTLSYEHANAAITINISLTAAQDTGAAGVDTVSNFESLTGSGFDDMLTGNTSINVIHGGAGNDHITGGGGADVLYGDSGADIFVFNAASVGTNVNIGDFSISQGDTLNVADILVGYNSQSDAISDFIHLTTSGVNTIITIDRDGNGTNYATQGLATLVGISSNDDQNTILQTHLIAA